MVFHTNHSFSGYSFISGRVCQNQIPLESQIINPHHPFTIGEKIFNVKIGLQQKNDENDVGPFPPPCHSGSNTKLHFPMLQGACVTRKKKLDDQNGDQPCSGTAGWNAVKLSLRRFCCKHFFFVHNVFFFKPEKISVAVIGKFF